MDNYLSFRWQDRQAAEPVEKQRKKRGGWRILLIVVLTIVGIGLLGVAAYFGTQYAAERYFEKFAADDGLMPYLPDLGISDDWTPDLLPQASCNPSVQVELTERGEDEPLTAGEVYNRVLPSVVCVQASEKTGYNIGSGIVISRSGYIITNYHIIEGGLDLTVMRLDNREFYNAALVGYDEELDLAVLKADGGDFVPAQLGNSDNLAVGDTVYAIGNPMGYLYGTMTDGIVSAVTERVYELDYPGRLIRTSAALNSGNSGGALVDAYGRVVGITSAKVTGVHNNVVIEGLGLAIPLTDAQGYLNRILRLGHSARPSMGIMCTDDTEKGVPGIRVKEVTAGTPAEGVLEEKDLIVAANDITVATVEDLTRILSMADPGDQISLTVLRKGQRVTVSVTLYDRMTVTE